VVSLLLSHADELKGCSWLDVGADTGALIVYLSEILRSETFELCDVQLAPPATFPYGRSPAPSWTTRTTASTWSSSAMSSITPATTPLRSCATPIESPGSTSSCWRIKETEADHRWTYADDRAGTFRDRKEWLALFSVLAFSVVHEQALDCHPHPRHVFVLAPNKGARGMTRP
jgi:hypothetical protein